MCSIIKREMNRCDINDNIKILSLDQIHYEESLIDEYPIELAQFETNKSILKYIKFKNYKFYTDTVQYFRPFVVKFKLQKI